MNPAQLVELGIAAAQIVAKIVEAIQNSAQMTADEKVKAFAALEAELQATNAAVQAVKFRDPVPDPRPTRPE